MAKQIPLYEIVYDSVLLRIITGEFRDGESIPSIPSLCSEYDVSAVTVRSALDRLESNGVIKTSRGVEAKVTFSLGGDLSDYSDWFTDRRDTIHNVLMFDMILSTAYLYYSLQLCEPMSARCYLLELLKKFDNSNRRVVDACALAHDSRQFILSFTKNPVVMRLAAQIGSFLRLPLMLSERLGAPLAQQYIGDIKRYVYGMLSVLDGADAGEFCRDFLVMRENAEQNIEELSRRVGISGKHSLTPVNIDLYAISGHNTTYKRIVDEIVVDLGMARYKLGEYLPCEAALCERFSTSLTTVRSAMKTLAKLGLCRTVNGRGTEVTFDFLENPSFDAESYRKKERGDELACSLQYMAVVSELCVRRAVNNIPQSVMDEFCERIVAFMSTPQSKFYFLPGMIMLFVNDYAESEFIRAVCRKRMVQIFISGFRRPIYNELYPGLFDFEHVDVSAAIERLRARDAHALSELIVEYCKKLYDMAALVAERFEFLYDVPFPAAGQLYGDKTNGETQWKNVPTKESNG